MEVWKRKRCWEAKYSQSRLGDSKKENANSNSRMADDEASAASGAVPLDLATLDDSIFGSTKERRRFTRSQKRAQARDKGTDAENSSYLRLTELTSEELQEAQQEDEQLLPLWLAAEENRDGFHIGEGLLHHHSEDDWGDEREQLVVPSKHRWRNHVVVDIVGPLQRTKQGNKYVLTFMDFSSIPLRKIYAATVAEAICQIFTRL